MPLVTFASNRREDVGRGVVNRQIEGIHLRTSVGIRMNVVVCTRLHVGVAIAARPNVGIDCCLGVRQVLRVKNRQMEHRDAVALVGSHINIVLLQRAIRYGGLLGGQRESVKVIRSVETNLIVNMPQHRVLDCQVEHRDAVTLVGPYIVVSALDDRARRACLLRGHKEPVIVIVIVKTNLIVNMMQNSVLDRQVKHRNAVTLVGSHVMVGALDNRTRRTRLLRRHKESVVVVLVLKAHRIVDVTQHRVLDRQVEHRDAVTLVDSHVIVGALNDRTCRTCLFGCYIEPVVIVFVVETNRIVDVLGRCVINRQMQRINLQTTVCILVSEHIIAALGVRRTIP